MRRTCIAMFACLNILVAFGQQKIDLLGSINETQRIKLSQIAKSVRTIQLETTDDCLLVPETMYVYYGKEFVFVFDGTEPGNFYRFNLNGKFMNKIGNAGPGPKEYIEGSAFKVDEKKKEVWIPDWQTNTINIYAYDGKFIRKIPTKESLIHNRFVIKGDSVFYVNGSFYRSSHLNELICADAQTGKIYSQLKSTIPNDLKIRILLDSQVLYTYKNNIHYKNPLRGDVYVVDSSNKKIKLSTKYQLNIGQRNHKGRDDYFKPQKNLKHLNVSSIYESDNFLLFFSGYNEDAYWTLCSKSTWECRSFNMEKGFINDLEPNSKPFVCRPFASMSQNHIIMVIPDEVGDDNPRIAVVELK